MPSNWPDTQCTVADLRRRGWLCRAGLFSISAMVLPVAGCAIAPRVDYTLDASRQSPNQSSRVRTLVLHYTAHTMPDSMATLTHPDKRVSSHYLVPDLPRGGGHAGDAAPTVYALVPESRSAWHAGASYWRGDRMLNASSIGIEIVNLGYPPEDHAVPPMQRRWYPFDDAQLAVVGRLAADIVARHRIAPDRVLAHADVAPGRKWDPGPRFPWRLLYQRYGVGAWPEDDMLAYYRRARPYAGDIAALQRKLRVYGYDAPETGDLDPRTLQVIGAFQMHFRPACYDGIPDAETVAILDALLHRYVGASSVARG